MLNGTIMSLKLKSFLLSATLIFSFISYKENVANAKTYDVATAKGPVKFKFTLSESTAYISSDKANLNGHKGQGSYIVIIDTGIQKNHPFFQDRVILEACFATRCPNGRTSMIGNGAASPTHWHGTHVAGIAAGSSTSFSGVAPEAKIIAINVFDSFGAAYDADIVKALNWVDSISTQYNIASVNMSLGSSTTFTTTCDNYIPSLTKAIKDLYDKNIATVVASGNSYAFGMSSPACISYSVSVAATGKTSDSIMDFSNVNTRTTFAAPGNNINSSKLDSTYGPASGTSMAAPFVTGAFALYKSKFGDNSVPSVVNDFKSTSKTALDSYTNIKVPRIDLLQLFSTEQSPTTTTSTTSTVVSTTTTFPSSTTSSTTTVVTPTTIAPPTKLPNIPRPLLLELNGLAKSFVWVKYKDPYTNKAFIDHYKLTCNNDKVYVIPKENMYSLHSYKLQVPASSIYSCFITGITIYGTKTSSSSVIKIYPRNKSNSLTIKKKKK